MLTRTQNVIVKIKGTRYYCAPAAAACGDLSESASVSLIPEPDNPYDGNAVAVMSKSGKMVGHIPRSLAPKYRELVLLDLLIASEIHRVEHNVSTNEFNVFILISYFSSDSHYQVNAPTFAGCYSLTLGQDRAYIGATSNLKKRCYEHLRNLLSKTHSNFALQADFDRTSVSAFTFSVLFQAKDLQEAEYHESAEIQRRLRLGEKLYNKTADGKGVYSSQHSNLTTISDRFKGGLSNVPSSRTHSPGKSSRMDKNLSLQHAVSTDLNRKDLLEAKKSGTYPTERREYREANDSSPSSLVDNLQPRNDASGSRLVMSDGSVYEGEVLDGKMHGHGKYTWINGDYYIGKFLYGIRMSGGGRYYRNLSRS